MFSAASWRRPASTLLVLLLSSLAVMPRDAAAAAAVSEDVPIPGGTVALAQALGIDPAPDRGRFVYEITRLLYNAPEGRRGSADTYLAAARQALGRRANADTRPGDVVPVPLTVDLWSTAIFHHTVAPRDLVTAIIIDRSASLLCLGLSSLDEGTLGFLADHPQLLERIYERSSPAFAVLAPSLRVQGNRVVPPGGDPAVALWEGATLEKVTRADRFIQQLLELNEGRLAYLFDAIGTLDSARRAFALGLWMPNATARAERFKALTVGVGAYRESHLRTLPLGRASHDLVMTLVARRGWSRRHARGAGRARLLVPRLRRRRSARRSRAPAAQRRRGTDRRGVAGRNDRAGRRAGARRAAGSDRVRPAAVWRRGPGGAVGRLDRGARTQPLPDADVDTGARRHSRALELRAGRAPRGATRRARRPARVRGAVAVSRRAGDPRARGRGHDLRRGQNEGAGRTAGGAAADRGRPLCRSDRALAARRSGRRGSGRRNHRAGGARGDVGTAVRRRADCAAGDLGRTALSPRSRRRRTPPPSDRP